MTRVAVLLAAVGLSLLAAAPAQASTALPPGHEPSKYSRWSYPSQVNYGPIETGSGNTGLAPSAAAFLTLPFMGPHYITSIFDHCGPNYNVSGRVCRYDGVVASKSVGGPDPTFDAGYAQTPGGHDFLYYSGHDGYDYGLFYEPVAAAAPGRVIRARYVSPSGLTVEIDHGNGLLTFYGHLSRIDVSTGQYVQRGKVIGISGMSGTATGPHLHFGVYHLDGSGAVDPYGWSGPGTDPWSRDVGDLWLGGSPRYAPIQMPSVSVSAATEVDNPSAVDVSWSSPGNMSFTVYYVTQHGTERQWLTPRGNGTAVFSGKPGQTYWFWASATSSLGWTDASGSPVVTLPHPSRGAVAA